MRLPRRHIAASSAAVVAAVLLGCGPGGLTDVKNIKHVLTGRSTLIGGSACQNRLMVRPQPDGPDEHFRAFVSAAQATPGSGTAWHAAKQARFEQILTEAELLRPESPETQALRAEFQQVLTLWRIRKGRQAAKRGLSFPETFVNSIGVKMRLVKGDAFLMGDGEGDGDESPVHTVRITRPFYIGVHEITARQYAAVVQGTGGDEPKTLVSWHEAMEFCRRLSAREGVTYSLPTESQWEFACRAGTQTPYSFGAEWTEAASRQPNPWGLHDMHGNAQEWCRDWYGKYYQATYDDPKGSLTGSARVVRGGSATQTAWCCRASSRDGQPPDSRHYLVGFRVIVILSPQEGE